MVYYVKQTVTRAQIKWKSKKIAEEIQEIQKKFQSFVWEKGAWGEEREYAVNRNKPRLNE